MKLMGRLEKKNTVEVFGFAEGTFYFYYRALWCGEDSLTVDSSHVLESSCHVPWEAVGKDPRCYWAHAIVETGEKTASLDVGVGPGRSQNNVGKLNLS